MKCNNCGQNNLPGKKFCTQCGNEINITNSGLNRKSYENSPKKHSTTISTFVSRINLLFRYILTVVVSMLVGIGLTYLLRTMKPEINPFVLYCSTLISSFVVSFLISSPKTQRA